MLPTWTVKSAYYTKASADSLREESERRLVSREGIEPDPATSRN